MDRTREARRTGVTVANGLSRRRPRTTSLRDSPGEDGQVELQETVRLRDRVQKKERDRGLLNRNKRRRGDRYVHGSNRDEVEECSEESVDGDEDDYEEEEGPAPRLIPFIQQSPSSSLSNHNHRGGLAPSRDIRSPPAWKPDEIIGVPIPRKARSTSGKKSHDYWFSGDVGVGGEQSHRRPPTSQAGRSIDGAPPSKKIRPIGPKTSLPKASCKLSSSFSSVQDDIEIEVAEALYDLMKQSQSKSSGKQEIALHSPVEKFALKDKIDTGDESRPLSLALAQTIPHISNLPEDNSSSFTPLLGSGLRRKRAEKVKYEEAKDEDEKSEILTKNSSVSSLTIADGEQPTNMETEISSPKLENRGREEASTNIVESQAVVEASLMSQKEEVVKQEEKSKPLTHATVAAQKEEVVKQEEKSKAPTQVTVAASLVSQKAGDVVLPLEEVAALKEESPPCAELANDPLDSTMTRANSQALEIESKREAKFEIDLMAPPPLASSPDRDGVIDFAVAPKVMAQDVEMKTETVDKMVKNEEVVGAIAANKMEKPDEDDSRSSGSIGLLDQKQQRHSKSTILEGKNSAQSSSLPFPIGTGWPGSLPLGYMPPLQTMPMGGTTGASPALQLQPPHFKLFQPCPNRCATHQYIARNIFYHQQFAKTNNIWPAPAGATSVYGAKPCDVNVATSAQNMYHGSPSLRGFSGEREQGVVSFSRINGKDKNTEVASIINATQKKQFLLQQAPQPVPAGNLLHGPAFIYPMSQHQTAVGTIANDGAGLPKSSTSASNGPLSGSSAIGAPVSSSSMPATALAASFNYPNLTANEALPYMAILQNNGYPFSISTHVGMPPPLKGGTHVPAMSFLDGSLYSSPVFRPSQEQPLVQPAHQLTSTSSGSSRSHKQLQSQQPQQSNPSYSSQKNEMEMTGEDKSLMVDKRAQKCTDTSNFAVPIQPMSFALMPSMTLGGRGHKNHGEQHQQQHGIKGGVDLIPPQAFVLSFASFNGSGTASAQNLSSMAQNPAIFQVLPDMARHAYQIAPAAQAVQQKNEGKTGGDSTNPDDRRTAILGKSPTSFGQSLSFSKPGCTDPSASLTVGTTVHDSSARTVNFISTVVPGSQPSHSIPTKMKAASVTSNLSYSQQQQQLIQTQNQHMTQQQMHQQRLTGATRIKAQTANSLPASSVAVKFPNNAPAFSQALMQINSSGQSPQWKNSSRNPTSQVPTSPLAVATTSNLKNVPQQKVRTSQGQTQISFGVSSNPGAPLHGQQIVSNNQSAAPLVGSPANSSISRSSGSSSRSASMGSKSGPAISALPSQQSETSSNGPSQKSSPVCRRNVPSILSTCPSHLSELKY